MVSPPIVGGNENAASVATHMLTTCVVVRRARLRQSGDRRRLTVYREIEERRWLQSAPWVSTASLPNHCR